MHKVQKIMLSEAKSHFFDQNDTKKPLKTELKISIFLDDGSNFDIEFYHQGARISRGLKTVKNVL